MSNSQSPGVIIILTIHIVCALGLAADQRQRLTFIDTMDEEPTGPPGSDAVGGAAA